MTTQDEQQTWSAVLKTHPEANFLQSPTWARMNELIGHKTSLINFSSDAWCQIIIKNARRGRYLEIPCGPLLPWNDEAIIRRMFASIKKLAKQEKCAFVRLRPQLVNTPENLQLLKNLNLKKSPMHLAAEHTVILDLTKSEDELLKDMRRQTRYEVRRASKLGITVDHGNSEQLFREFHTVQSATAARQHFIPPDLATLLAERTAFGDHAQIYVAKTSGNQPIAYGLILSDGQEAAYYEAASAELNHKLPGAYALQWQVIRDLKKQGITRYNLWGIAPPGQKNHRYSGVTTFKTGFGGEIREFVPAHDLVISPLRYALDWTIETIRKKRRHL